MLLIKKVFYEINRIFVYVSIFSILFVMFLTTADVIGRFFGHPIKGVYELVELSLALTVFLALGQSQITKSHLGVDFFVSKLPLRRQSVIDFLGYGVSLVMFSLAFWQMVVFAKRMYVVNLETGVLRLPIFPWVIISSFGVLLIVFVLLKDFINEAAKIFKREGYN